MIDYVRMHPDVREFMLVTECGLSDRMRIEFPDRRFIGTCALCPHMKRVELRKVLEVLESRAPSRSSRSPRTSDAGRSARSSGCSRSPARGRASASGRSRPRGSARLELTRSA